MESFASRSILLVGEEKYRKLEQSCVLVVGIGGVGGTALECLARSGIKKFVIIDYDNVSISNLNRQILFKNEDVGKSKVAVAKERLKGINPQIEVVSLNQYFDENILNELDKFHFDYIVDAIDSIKSKVTLIKYALKKDIKIIVSLGMANRLDPSKVLIERLDKTINCPLAKKLRSELRKEQIDLKKIMCAFSKEIPHINGSYIASMMMVPSSAGLNIASYVITNLMEE